VAVAGGGAIGAIITAASCAKFVPSLQIMLPLLIQGQIYNDLA
jgi:hypothetical protein